MKWGTWRTAAIVSLAMVFVGVSALSAKVFALPVAEAAQASNLWQVAAPWSEVESGALRLSMRPNVNAVGSVQAYTSGDGVVALYTAAFPPAAASSELIGAGDERLTETGLGTRSVELPGRSVVVNETLLRSERATVRLWTWFEIEGRPTPSGRVAKLLCAKARLLGIHEPSLQIAVATEEQENADAIRVLTDFVAHLQPVDDQN